MFYISIQPRGASFSPLQTVVECCRGRCVCVPRVWKQPPFLLLQQAHPHTIFCQQEEDCPELKPNEYLGHKPKLPLRSSWYDDNRSPQTQLPECHPAWVSHDPEQRCLNLNETQKDLEGSFKPRWLTPPQSVSFRGLGWGETGEAAFLASSQVMLMLLVSRPAFENHWQRGDLEDGGKGQKPFSQGTRGLPKKMMAQ